MDLSQILCIDVGSTYTKIGIRREWNCESELLPNDALDSEWNFCFPSVVAEVTRGVKTKWVTCDEAFSQIPGDNVQIYNKWKSDLFKNPDLCEDDKYQRVVHEYFRGIFYAAKDSIDNFAGLQLPTRICIPKLKGAERVASLFITGASAAGFKCADERPYVFEPESNVYGVFTRGRNHAWMPKNANQRCPGYKVMFGEDNFFKWLSVGAKANRSGFFSAVSIDVGSFTTDIGCVKFAIDEGDIENFHRPEVTQVSEELGINQLDDDVLNSLGEEISEVIRQQNMLTRERNKPKLYNGDEFAVRGKNKIIIGGEGHQRFVGAAIVRFAKKIVKVLRDFCDEHAIVPSQLILTGGGMSISRVRSAVVKACQDDWEVGIVNDLLDEEEPARTLPWVKTAGGEWIHDQEVVRKRLLDNRNLVRGGSAIGGCSVFCDLPREI